MKTYILNGKMLNTRESAYDEIIRALEMPPHFGRNLDALWDELSTLQATIILEHVDAISGYGETIMHLIQEAAEENITHFMLEAESFKEK